MKQSKSIKAGSCPLLQRSKNRSPTLFRLCFIFLFNLTVNATDFVNSYKTAVDLSPIVRMYNYSNVESLIMIHSVPAGFDNKTGVHSKDVVFSPRLGLSARIYIPKSSIDRSRKRPVVVFFHGGGFVTQSIASPTYRDYLNNQVSESDIVLVSIDYRLAPKNPLPAGYDDSWAGLKWVASHWTGNGPDRWINDYADLNRLYIAGDSAGANIANRVGVRSGKEGIGNGVNVKGIILMNPYFLGKSPVGGEGGEPVVIRALLVGIWFLAYPKTVGLDDPWINPDKDPNLKMMGCEKVLVCVAGKDPLRYRGRHYYEVLKTSGWVGSVEIFESDGQDHVFFLDSNQTAGGIVEFRNRISSFINRD